MKRKLVNKNCHAERLTLSQIYGDKLTKFCGSWKFIIFVFVFMFFWGVFNVVGFVKHWDPYPYIFLNFILSCMAAIQAPIILMSQNRVEQRDRIKAERDYIVNRKAEREVEHMQKELDTIKSMLANKRK
jgi:uncharacterized membrane protein